VQLTSRYCGGSTNQLGTFEIGFYIVKLITYSCLVCIYCTDLSSAPSTKRTTSFLIGLQPIQDKVGPIHYLFRKKFIPSPPETRALQNTEIPEEEKAGEDIASKRRVRNKYIKPSKRPLYSLQVECLIIISRALHLYKGGTSLTYHFEDSEDKGSYWSFTLPSTAHRPIGFNLRPYSWLEIA
jgi:hypothetical protein